MEQYQQDTSALHSAVSIDIDRADLSWVLLLTLALTAVFVFVAATGMATGRAEMIIAGALGCLIFTPVLIATRASNALIRKKNRQVAQRLNGSKP